MTAPIDLEAPWPKGEIRLWDSQWMNIVNGDCASPALDREEAINLAIKLTEQAMRKNYEAELTTRRARDAEVEVLVAAAKRVLDKEWEYGDDQPHCVALSAAIDDLNGETT
jgi:hypothetical protein